MNAHQLALQTARLALLKTFNSTDLLQLWKLNFLYSLHFQGSEEPTFEAIYELLEREPTAVFFANGSRILNLWREQQELRQQAARVVASMVGDDMSPEAIAQAHQNSIDYSLKTAESYEGLPKAFEHWLFTYLLHSLTVEDIQQACDALKEGQNVVINQGDVELFLFVTTQT